VAAIGVLRRERDSLRAELGAARAELAVRSKDGAEADRRLRATEAEITRLRRELAAIPPMPVSPRPEPPPAEPAPPGPSSSKIVTEVLDGAFFASGGADVMPEAGPRLAAIAELIRIHPEARVRIVGYTDASGDPASNQTLFLARAESIRGRLAALLAVDPAYLEVEGRGPADPVADNATAEGRRANRRVVVTIGP
jgi:outer membrane protein OmpA-like peptidoglycan-associated protein